MLQPDSQPLTRFQAGRPASNPVDRLRSQSDKSAFRKREPTFPPELKGSSSRAICNARLTQSI